MSSKLKTSQDEVSSNSERCLTLLLDAAARGAVEVESPPYQAFRASVDVLARRIPDRLPDEEKLALIRSINHEFESYRSTAEDALRERMAAWRSAVTLLLDELIHDLGIEASSPKVAPLLHQLRRISATQEISTWRDELNTFLHPLDGASPADEMSAKLRSADCSTANDNAAGLLGGGAALERLRQIMQQQSDGFVVLFSLSCMEIVNQRFGPTAVEDCLMAVSAYLTSGLEGNDSIYHWSDSALLAILENRPSEALVSAELQRIIARNRESIIKISGRAVVLRIPITLQITPIHNLRTPEDLLRISARPSGMR